MPRLILGFENAEAVAQYAALEFVRRARAAIEASGAFRVALAGGSTPRRTYELLADPSLAHQVDWEGMHIFFGDERSVVGLARALAWPDTRREITYSPVVFTMLSRTMRNAISRR